MNDKEYDQIAEKLEKELNEKGTLVEFKVLSAFEYITKWEKQLYKDIPLEKFIIMCKICIEDRRLIGWTFLSPGLITDSAIDIVDKVCEQSADCIAKMILSSDARKIPTVKEAMNTALSNISAPLETS